MAVWVSPLPESLPVEPGGEASCRVTIRNDSEIVDEYLIEVLGEAAGWSTVEPERISLMPGTSAEATITFRPPRDTTLPPGLRPLGVKASSVERPATSAVEEGALDILGFDLYTMELIPRTSHGSRGGKHEIAFDNRGNRPTQVRLTASDADGLLRFRFDPPALDAAPGTASFAKVNVRFRKRFLRGPGKLRQFVVTAEPDGAEPLTAQGTAVQQALVATWVLGVLAGILGLLLVWFLFFQPEIKDTANEAAKKEVAKAVGSTSTDASDTDATDTTGGAGGGGGGGDENGGGGGGGSGDENGGGGSGDGSGSGGSGSGGSGGSGSGVPSFVKRLTVGCAARKTCTAEFTIPDGKTFSVHDVVLGNPNNAKGTLTVRNGGTALFVENLDNFRDLDFHFDPGIAIGSGKKLAIVVRCGATGCSSSGLFSGSLG